MINNVYPLLWAWGICIALAVVVLIGCALDALWPTRAPVAQRPPIRRAARTSAYSVAHAARATTRIPGPRKAPESPLTIPTGIAIPPDTYAQELTDEMTAVLGCTCSPILGGTPTMTQPTEHTISTEWELTWAPSSPAADDMTRTKTMIFGGPTAEEDAYDIAELLAATDGPWTMRTRTVDTAVTPAPWVEVARYAILGEPIEAGD